MSKQTAVEWLIEEINQMQKIYIDLNKKDKSLKKGVDAILTATTLLKMKCITAKEMEKEQIKEAFKEGNLYHGWALKHEPEKYYNETYKKEEK
jgi:hypothetical protein